MMDVLVVGAGPVGLAMAAELKHHGTSIRIIDKVPLPLFIALQLALSLERSKFTKTWASSAP